MKKLTKGSMAAISLAASLTMLVAGCGSSTSGANNTSSAADGQPVDGGQLTIGQGTKFDDQFLPDVDASLYTANITNFAYDYLLTTDQNLNFQAGLVKAWDWSADKKTLTMHLQPNANWSDGKPITSDDVLFTMNYLASQAYTNTLQGQYGYLVSSVVGYDKISSGKATSFASTGGFKKIDDKTFSLTFSTVDAAVLYSMIANIQPLPEHVLKNVPIQSWSTAAEDKQPTVVSGPFTFSQVTSDSVTMAANPNYWNGKPHIDTVVWKTVNPDVAPGLLSSGQIDFMLNGLKPNDVNKLKNLSGVSVKTMPENGFSYLGLKLYQKEFQDVRVRQAFEYALDRNAMVQGILKGYGTPLSNPLPPATWVAPSASDGINSYNYDPNKANQLLDQAGWKKQADGSRIDPVTGKTADLHLSYSSGSPTNQAEAVAIQQYLGKVGVKVTLDTPEDFNELAKRADTDDKSLQMWLMAWSLSSDPDPRGLWQSTDAMNLPRWKDPKNDQLIAKTFDASAFDKSTRKEAFKQWALYVNQQMPYVFLWAPDDVWAYNDRVHIPANDWAVTGPFNYQDWWVTK